MSINPLQTMLPLVAPPARGSESRKTGDRSFDALLNALAGGNEKQLAKAGRDAADVLRMQMMQESLSLLGEEAAPPSSVPELGTLLADLQGNVVCPEPKADKAAALPSDTAASLPVALPAFTGADSLIRTASRFLGTPYHFGANGPYELDCSSFVQQVFREHNINLPRTAREQSMVGSEVPYGELKEGDLVFFATYASYPSHVGIYLGNGKMIHASSGKGEVAVSDMNSEYFRSRFLGARRVG